MNVGITYIEEHKLMVVDLLEPDEHILVAVIGDINFFIRTA